MRQHSQNKLRTVFLADIMRAQLSGATRNAFTIHTRCISKFLKSETVLLKPSVRQSKSHRKVFPAEQKMADQQEQDVPDRLQLSKVIGEKLTESIQNMDLINTLQKMVATEPGDEESEVIRDNLRGILAQFKDMSPEDKAKFASKIKEGLASKLSTRLKDNAMLAGVEDAIRSAVMTKLYMVAAVVLLVIFLLVFFGYKLYKSIKDKEIKREEKKKAKQMKKKK